MQGVERRQLMNDPKTTRRRDGEDWQGFREVDRAIAENRLTSYTWKKTWADSWGRLKLILIFFALAAFVTFVVIYDLIL